MMIVGGCKNLQKRTKQIGSSKAHEARATTALTNLLMSALATFCAATFEGPSCGSGTFCAESTYTTRQVLVAFVSVAGTREMRGNAIRNVFGSKPETRKEPRNTAYRVENLSTTNGNSLLVNTGQSSEIGSASICKNKIQQGQ